MAVLLVVRFERLADVGRDRQLTRARARRPVRVRPLRQSLPASAALGDVELGAIDVSVAVALVQAGDQLAAAADA